MKTLLNMVEELRGNEKVLEGLETAQKAVNKMILLTIMLIAICYTLLNIMAINAH